MVLNTMPPIGSGSTLPPQKTRALTDEEIARVNEKLEAQVRAAEGLKTGPKTDLVNHPPHYTNHPSGVECIQITRHMSFDLGNAMKYIWRAGNKESENEAKDIAKAIWYLQDHLKLIEGESGRE